MLSILLTLTLAPQAIAEGLGDECVLRVYEVAGFALSRSPTSEWALQAIPSAGTQRGGASFFEVDDRPPLVDADLETIITELVDPHTWNGGPSYVSVEGERLVVFASPETQKKVEWLLEEISEAVIDAETLSIRILEGKGLPNKIVYLDDQQREAMLSKAGDQITVISEAQTQLINWDVHHLRQQISYPLVVSWEVEIAMGSFGLVPVPTKFRVGLELIARASHWENGSTIDLIVQQTQIQHAPRLLDLELENRASSGLADLSALQNPKNKNNHAREGGPLFQLKDSIRLELPTIAFTSVAGTFFVPSNRSCWFPLEFSGGDNAVPRILELRCTHEDRSNPRRITDFSDATLESPGTFVFKPLAYGLGVEGSAPSHDHDMTFGFDERLPLQLSESDDWHPRFEESLMRTSDREDVQVIMAPPFALVKAPDTVVREMAKTLRLSSPRPKRFQLSCRVLGTDRGSFAIPVSVGRPSHIYGGRSIYYLRRWVQDVASFCWVTYPVVDCALDGYGLKIEVFEMGRYVQLRCQGFISILEDDVESVDLRSRSTPIVERLRTRTLEIDETRVLGIDDLGGQRVRFGGESLGLEVVVKSTAE